MDDCEKRARFNYIREKVEMDGLPGKNDRARRYCSPIAVRLQRRCNRVQRQAADHSSVDAAWRGHLINGVN
jgi:hypothetical protein